VDVLIGERFFVTISRAHAEFLGKVRKAYRADFLRFAKSPSFLIYEIWDHLIQTYELVEKGFQQEVERIQALLSQKVDDGIFTEVSQLNSALLYFRKHVAPARNVLTELSTRKSIFVSEPTQPFLLSMVAHLERILADVIVNRDIVRDSLDLYMSIVGYRTNMVMNRLTLVTFLFLPLTFLTGIYGMESVSVPSISWPVFWSMALTCFVLVLVALKRFKLL
jgi:magnesium transporter